MYFEININLKVFWIHFRPPCIFITILNNRIASSWLAYVEFNVAYLCLLGDIEQTAGCWIKKQGVWKWLACSGVRV